MRAVGGGERGDVALPLFGPVGSGLRHRRQQREYQEQPGGFHPPNLPPGVWSTGRVPAGTFAYGRLSSLTWSTCAMRVPSQR